MKININITPAISFPSLAAVNREVKLYFYASVEVAINRNPADPGASKKKEYGNFVRFAISHGQLEQSFDLKFKLEKAARALEHQRKMI